MNMPSTLDDTLTAKAASDDEASAAELAELEDEFYSEAETCVYGDDKADAVVNDLEKDLSSLTWSALGFGVAASFDLVGWLLSAEKRRAWYGSMKRLVDFMFCSGIWTELLEGFASHKLLSNMRIMGKIQNEFEASANTNRRNKVALKSTSMTNEEKKAIMENAARYARYSTAAYGALMIKSAKAETVFQPPLPAPVFSLIQTGLDLGGGVFDKVADVLWAKEMRKHKIRRFLGLRKPDLSRGIRDELIEVDNVGADANVVGFIIAIERRGNATLGLHKSVVLAVRGTYSFSGLKADAEGFTTPFCGGHAHKGIYTIHSRTTECSRQRQPMQ